MGDVEDIKIHWRIGAGGYGNRELVRSGRDVTGGGGEIL